MFSSMKSIRNRRVIPISGGFRDRMTAFGRKRPFKTAVFSLIECPVSVKADIADSSENHHGIVRNWLCRSHRIAIAVHFPEPTDEDSSNSTNRLPSHVSLQRR